MIRTIDVGNLNPTKIFEFKKDKDEKCTLDKC